MGTANQGETPAQPARRCTMSSGVRPVPVCAKSAPEKRRRPTSPASSSDPGEASAADVARYLSQLTPDQQRALLRRINARDAGYRLRNIPQHKPAP